MPIELIYFDLKARGEPIRVALHHAGIDFTDTRVSFADWGALKPSIPSGALPVIKKDGKCFAESNALLRWAGKKAGLYPTDRHADDAALAVDEVLDICQDILTKAPQDQDEAKKKAMREEYASTKLKAFFDQLTAKASACSGGFIAGEELTIADLALQYFIFDLISSGMFDYVPTNYVHAWPVLSALSKKIATHPVVQSWDNRGEDDGEAKAGDVNGYGMVAVDLAAEAKRLKDMKAQGLNPDGTPYVHLPGMDLPPPVAMKRNPITGEMEQFHSEKLKDDLPEEEEETAEVELPCGDSDDY